MLKIILLLVIVAQIATGQINDKDVGKIITIDNKDYLILMFERDKWTGWDKVAHFGAGFAIEYAFEEFGLKKEISLGTTIALAAFYEWFDMTRGVGFSYKDFIYSSAGAVASYMIRKYVFNK